jgi:hypothetical protein
MRLTHPHLHPLPSEDEETKIHPLPRCVGEGKGEGEEADKGYVITLTSA